VSVASSFYNLPHYIAFLSLSHTHTHTRIHSCGQFSISNSPILHVFVLWGKLEHPEETHADTGKSRKLHTESNRGPSCSEANSLSHCGAKIASNDPLLKKSSRTLQMLSISSCLFGNP